MTPEHRPYPKILVNKDGATRRVESSDEELALGDAWQYGYDGKHLPAIADRKREAKERAIAEEKAKADADSQAKADAEADAKAKADAKSKAK